MIPTFHRLAVPVALALLLPALGAAQTAPSEPARIEHTPDAVTVHHHGVAALRYVRKKPADSPLASESAGYFHPLTSPAGVVLTEVGPSDHRHHRGVFLAWVEMHGAQGVDADFWGWGAHAPTNGRRLVSREIADVREAADVASFTARNEWRAEDDLLLDEELRASFAARDGLYILDLAYTPTPARGVTLSRWAFSGFCVRTRKDGVAAFDPDGAVQRRAPDHLKPESDWPDRRWYAFTLNAGDGKRAGVAVLNHPANPPTFWHNVTGIGMLNPCIVAPGEVPLTARQPLVLRYRVVTFDGETPAAKLEELARKWRASHSP